MLSWLYSVGGYSHYKTQDISSLQAIVLLLVCYCILSCLFYKLYNRCWSTPARYSIFWQLPTIVGVDNPMLEEEREAPANTVLVRRWFQSWLVGRFVCWLVVGSLVHCFLGSRFGDSFRLRNLVFYMRLRTCPPLAFFHCTFYLHLTYGGPGLRNATICSEVCVPLMEPWHVCVSTV